MKVTKIKLLDRCKSMRLPDRYRFFKDLPPLAPGHTPDPSDAGIIEIFPPEDWGAHRLYRIEESKGLHVNETALFAFMDTEDPKTGKKTYEPVCWLAQASRVLQGRDAIKQVFGELYQFDNDHTMAVVLASLRTALDRVAHFEPDCRYLLAMDMGEGYVIETSNDPEAMKRFRDVLNPPAD